MTRTAMTPAQRRALEIVAAHSVNPSGLRARVSNTTDRARGLVYWAHADWMTFDGRRGPGVPPYAERYRDHILQGEYLTITQAGRDALAGRDGAA